MIVQFKLTSYFGFIFTFAFKIVRNLVPL